MISGVLLPDSGRILLDGRQCLYGASHDAIKAGISMVYQELSMVGSMSIAENIFANRQPINRIGIIRPGKLYRDTDELMQRFNLRINPRTLGEAPLHGPAAAHRDPQSRFPETQSPDPR